MRVLVGLRNTTSKNAPEGLQKGKVKDSCGGFWVSAGSSSGMESVDFRGELGFPFCWVGGGRKADEITGVLMGRRPLTVPLWVWGSWGLLAIQGPNVLPEGARGCLPK